MAQGAVGGFIGFRLAAAGRCAVSAVARGATLQALRQDGWRLQLGGTLLRGAVHASDDPDVLGAQDLVVVTVKGPALPAVATRIGPLLGPDTVVLSAMNGVPWWFFDGRPGAFAGMRLESVDPGGVGHGLIIGEPDGSASPRLAQLAELLADAGFEVTSALTGATGDRILDDPLVRAFCSAAMEEAAAIGGRIGCDVTQTPEERHAVTRKLCAFKTSMLQDAETGKPLEIDAIVGAVKEIGSMRCSASSACSRGFVASRKPRHGRRSAQNAKQPPR